MRNGRTNTKDQICPTGAVGSPVMLVGIGKIPSISRRESSRYSRCHSHSMRPIPLEFETAIIIAMPKCDLVCGTNKMRVSPTGDWRLSRYEAEQLSSWLPGRRWIVTGELQAKVIRPLRTFRPTALPPQPAYGDKEVRGSWGVAPPCPLSHISPMLAAIQSGEWSTLRGL